MNVGLIQLKVQNANSSRSDVLLYTEIDWTDNRVYWFNSFDFGIACHFIRTRIAIYSIGNNWWVISIKFRCFDSNKFEYICSCFDICWCRVPLWSSSGMFTYFIHFKFYREIISYVFVTGKITFLIAGSDFENMCCDLFVRVVDYHTDSIFYLVRYGLKQNAWIRWENQFVWCVRYFNNRKQCDHFSMDIH